MATLPVTFQWWLLQNADGSPGALVVALHGYHDCLDLHPDMGLSKLVNKAFVRFIADDTLPTKVN